MMVLPIIPVFKGLQQNYPPPSPFDVKIDNNYQYNCALYFMEQGHKLLESGDENHDIMWIAQLILLHKLSSNHVVFDNNDQIIYSKGTYKCIFDKINKKVYIDEFNKKYEKMNIIIVF